MLVTMQLSLPRDGRHVGMMRDVAACMFEDFDAPADAIGEVQIALTEACANAVRHARDCDDYQVTLAVDEHGCRIEVTDLGPGFDAPTPPEPAGLEDESGRGLLLMRALVDDLEFHRSGPGVAVTLQKYWSDEEGADAPPR
jgi:serine/threonine-protein kinase RsbW